MRDRARLIAFYLPQFHPIPENDAWWGKGFTEWTNVARAKPLFKGHYQPHLPADLGFYDLRVPEVREHQAELARNAGIDGFCYYHYWFGRGKRLLERPFNEVLWSGKPDFPFCICWANQTWSGIWHGEPNRILAQQTYPGKEDVHAHFIAVRDAFLDPRYMKVDGKPIFSIFRPLELPNPIEFITEWQDMAMKCGLPGIHFVAYLFSREFWWDYRAHGFDNAILVNTHKLFSMSTTQLALRSWSYAKHSAWRVARAKLGKFRHIRLYAHARPYLLSGCDEHPKAYLCVTPNWDNTPRSGRSGYVYDQSTPELFRLHLRDALHRVEAKDSEDRIIFIKAWNEWAEGNYLEPDEKFGDGYLTVLKEETGQRFDMSM